MIGADTSFLIDFFRGKEEAERLMDENKEVIHLCENVVYEFLSGNLTGREKEKFLGFVEQFPVHEFDRKAAITSSEISRSGKRKGKTVPHPDAMIAGIYISNKVDRIATRNPTHFENIDEIEIVNYVEDYG